MTKRLAVVAVLLAAPAIAQAGRPDTGGDRLEYDETDVLDFLDGPAGVVRVHYSVDGPNATLLDDDDDSGYPDYPEEVAATAEEVLAAFEDAGFRRPLSEADLGLRPLGGSDAFDFYLIDYGGSADGEFSIDACEDGVCAGHMLMENDFRFYGYPSISEAIRVLTSHEQFHAVQAAYTADLPGWVSEGTAVWAERLYDETVEDFLWFASEYLDDTGRSIDRPPAGVLPPFIYGTCLFWEFLSERLGDEVIVSLLEESVSSEGTEPTIAAITDAGGTLRDEWIAFTAANLATGRRAGAQSFYPFAADVDGIEAKVRDSFLHDQNRFYPLAATYYFLDHPGGALWFSTVDDPAGLFFALHRVDGRGESAELAETVATWEPASAGAVLVAEDLEAGDYWLRGTYPLAADQSRRIDFCLGLEDDVAPCVPPEPDAGIDAGVDAGLDAAVGPAPDAAADASATGGGVSGGGGCSAMGAPSHLSLSWLLAAGLLSSRRRR